MSSLKYSDKAFLNYSFPWRRLSNHFDLPRNFPRNTNSSITQPLSSISIIAERPLEIFPSVQIIMRKKKRRRRKKKCQWEIYRFIRQGIRVFSRCSFDTYPFHTLFLPLRCKLERLINSRCRDSGWSIREEPYLLVFQKNGTPIWCGFSPSIPFFWNI